MRSWQHLLDGVGLFLVVFAGLNVAGIVQMATGIEGGLSAIVFACSLLLLAGCASTKWLDPAYSWFVIFMVAYLLGGLAPLVMDGVFNAPRMISYGGTVIFSSALYFWIVQRGATGLDLVLRVIQVLFLIDCIAVMNTDSLGTIFAYDFPTERGTGFFHNPNESAVMALYAIVLIVTTGGASARLTALKLTIVLVALALTFSKTGFFLLAFLGVLYLLVRRFYFTLVVAILTGIAALPSVAYIVSANPFDMTEDQRHRIEQILRVFAGEIDNQVTTGRLELWSMGLERISKTFPFGGGIGSLHRMEGGFTDLGGDWLGVHNTFLMVLGESGLVPFVMLLMFVFVLARSAFASLRPLALVGILLVFVGDMIVSHGVLAIRLHGLMLAVLMAACALQNRAQLRLPRAGER